MSDPKPPRAKFGRRRIDDAARRDFDRDGTQFFSGNLDSETAPAEEFDREGTAYRPGPAASHSASNLAVDGAPNDTPAPIPGRDAINPDEFGRPTTTSVSKKGSLSTPVGQAPDEVLIRLRRGEYTDPQIQRDEFDEFADTARVKDDEMQHALVDLSRAESSGAFRKVQELGPGRSGENRFADEAARTNGSATPKGKTAEDIALDLFREITGRQSATRRDSASTRPHHAAPTALPAVDASLISITPAGSDQEPSAFDEAARSSVETAVLKSYLCDGKLQESDESIDALLADYIVTSGSFDAVGDHDE